MTAAAEIADRLWAAMEAVRAAEERDRQILERATRGLMSEIANFLAAAVVKQFMATFPSIYARAQWKERQRLVRLIARRAREET